MTVPVSQSLAPQTWVLQPDDLPPAPGAGDRRRLHGVTAADLVVTVGSGVAALAVAWLLCYALLPWGTPLAFAVVSFVFYLVIVTVTTSAVSPGPAVADRVAAAVITGGAGLVALGLGSAVVFVFVRAWPALWHWNMYTQDMAGVGPRDALSSGGLLHAVVGTVIQVGIAVVVTVPLALGAAVYMTEVGGRFARVVRTVVEAMTALPSIVAGLFVYTTLLLALGMSKSGFAAAMALSVMMLPIIARAADVVLRVVPSGLREASLALGASRWRTVWHVVLPTARPGLATALILGVARGVGETSPVLLTSGASTFLVGTPFGQQMNSLPLFVFSTVRSGEPIFIQRGFAAAAVLLTLVLGLFALARYIARPRGNAKKNRKDRSRR
ncbi:MAG: phosphate ABC transporter permease PstA [Micrococcales bacterium]|nr:phosphate ABC transporter permease PstA [Micrococcales bacterium]